MAALQSEARDGGPTGEHGSRQGAMRKRVGEMPTCPLPTRFAPPITKWNGVSTRLDFAAGVVDGLAP